MRYVFFALVLIHAVIHFAGFAKSRNPAAVSSLQQNVSPWEGMLWLVAGVALLVSAGLWITGDGRWWWAALPALILSQFLIGIHWKEARFGSILNLLILFMALLGLAEWRYEAQYRQRVASLFEMQPAASTAVLSEEDIAALPLPVQGYLRFTRSVGKPKVSDFSISFIGKIRKNEASEWMPFNSEQFNFLIPSARLFFMKAVMKGLPVAGYHRFEQGKASMDIRLLSAIRVQYQDGAQMDTAETVTFFNDMCCMAPATLIDPRIEWLETRGNEVNAAFSADGIRITARLIFDERGALVNFISNDRYAAGENGAMRKIPWSTPIRDYREMHGYFLPARAETIYHYPEGDLCYGVFELSDISYHCYPKPMFTY